MMKRLCPRRLGSLVQAHARRLSLLLCLAILILCAAINSGKLDAELSSWIQRTTRVESELQAIEAAIGDGAGSNNLLILQTPKKQAETSTISKLSESNKNRQSKKIHSYDENKVEGRNNNNNDVLSVASMMIHLEALAIATHVTIDMFDVSWSLKDICLAPTPPDYEGLLVNQMLDHLMPCVIKTPLDCFWEGAKLLGPEQDIRLSSIGPKLKWTNLDPLFMIEAQQRALPHASFPYQTLLNWMRRVGITDGYLNRPCLDPSDPNCPTSAPNKLSGEAPNVGHILTGGCRGLATKQMHWKEEELVGGVVKNKSGYIVAAEALQSTVLLMGERDVYDYWRKTSKVQDINNWSIDKAKLVLDRWQERFKEELAQFTRSSITTNSFKVHALTPKAMLEPIHEDTILDLTTFKVTAIFMTTFICIVFPNFRKFNAANGSADHESAPNNIDRVKITILALATSTIVISTFIASLGFSSFINLPFNLATTQILPPLALFYGFRQALMIANTYSHYYKQTAPDDLTVECLLEMMPIIVMECTTFIIPLIVATAFPVQATRVFALQAITYILLSTMMAIVFIPSLFTIFLTENRREYEESIEIKYSDRPKSRSRSMSPGIVSITSKKSSMSTQKVGPTLEEQIFSRLQDDLKNIKSSPQGATDINFSARFGPDGLKTSFSLRTNRETGYSAKQPAVELKTPEPTFDLPDLLLRPDTLDRDVVKSYDLVEKEDTKSEICAEETDENGIRLLIKFYEFLTKHKFFQSLIVLLKIIMVVAILSNASKVKFGLQLRDIIMKGTNEYESFMLREKYFPVYNIFAITKSGLDYPSNQKLLHELYERISHVDGIVKDEHGAERKFWLTYFRDWLLELQENFDQERNRSVISKEGWNDEASDAAKLAYKLLAQTGKIDNPIDKELVDTNRLVDKNGIINQKAFYYYLTAWVMNDAFTYSNSEADFRPQPKTWNENPNDLRIERARPLTYAQIPFLMKLPEDHDNMKSILEIRAISQRFEQLDIPNFPTGIPFIFWDQFINLDYLFYTAIMMIAAVLFLLIGLALTNFVIAAIIIVPMITTIFEICSILGHLSMPFNSIIGVIVISFVGIMTVQVIQIIMCFESADGEVKTRVCNSMSRSFRTVIIGLTFLMATTYVFHNSKIDFMTKYSCVLIYLIAMSTFNSLLLTPALLGLLGSEHEIVDSPVKSPSRSPIRSPKLIKKLVREKDTRSKHGRKKHRFPRVQSEISLSTISEEPQSETQAHDMKINVSIRC